MIVVLLNSGCGRWPWWGWGWWQARRLPDCSGLLQACRMQVYKQVCARMGACSSACARECVESVPYVPSVTCPPSVYASEFVSDSVSFVNLAESASRPISMSLPHHTAAPSTIDCPPLGSRHFAALMASPNSAVPSDCVMTSSHT